MDPQDLQDKREIVASRALMVCPVIPDRRVSQDVLERQVSLVCSVLRDRQAVAVEHQDPRDPKDPAAMLAHLDPRD